MLINNVGCETGEPEPLELKSSKDMQQIIDLNITFNAQLTRACLGSMIENAKELRVKGIVVNLASQAALLENPMISTYSAAKAFNTSFSRALAGEMRNHHKHKGIIHVCNLRPAIVESAMHAVNKFGHCDDISPVPWHDMVGTFLSQFCPSKLKETILYRLSMVRYNKKKVKGEYKRE